MKNVSMLAAAVVCLACPMSAMAQSPANLPGQDGGLITWGVAVGLAVIVLLTGFLNPKRSHLT